MKLLRPFLMLTLALALPSLVACGLAVTNGQNPGGRQVALDERFKLEVDESVSVKETGLSVRLKGVRRSWLANGKGETVDVDLIVVKADGKEQRQWIKLGEKAAAGGYVVQLVGAYPFGKENATLVVSKE